MFSLTNRISGEKNFCRNHLKFINTAEDDFFKRGSYKQTYGKSFSVSSDINLNYSHNWDKHILFANLELIFVVVIRKSIFIRQLAFRMIRWIISFCKQYADNSKPTGSESIDRELGRCWL